MPGRDRVLTHPVTMFAKQVTAGRLHDMCGPYEIKACQRHLDDLKRIGDPDFPYVFDTTRADRIFRWFSQCVQTRGPEAGQPIELQDWQKFDLGNVYGWVHKDTGARRYNKTYEKRARGNFKSTEKSGQCLYAMCGDAIYPPYQPELAQYEREPEVECAAVDRGQAMRVYGDAKAIAEASPKIARRLVIPKANPVRHRKLGGYMRALSKDTKNKDSGAPTFFCVDEYHAHPTSTIYDIGLNSFGKRWQPLLACITTAGDDAENKPCFNEELYAKRVLDGLTKDDRYFIMIRELPEDADPHDKREWLKANPCLRIDNDYSRTLRDQIESEYTTAYGSNDATKIRQFLTRRMDRWQATAEHSYLDEHARELARAAMIPADKFAELTDGSECWCGYDLGKRIDLSGVAAVFLLPDGRVAVKMHGFLPEGAAIRHEHSDRIEYRAWAERGWCTLTPGDVTDNSYVDDWIQRGQMEHGWKVVNVCYDGHNATDLAIRMNERAGDDDWCVEISQTCAGQNLAVKGFRELLLQGKIVIEESGLALWCLKNAVEIENNYGDLKLNKKNQMDTQRIDPVAAMMNALAQALVRRNNPTLSDRLEDDGWTM